MWNTSEQLSTLDWTPEWTWPTCSRPSSSVSVPVSPLLLIGISIVAALLIMLSVIMQCTCREQDKKRTDKTEREREREMRNRHKSLVKDGKDEMEPQAPNAAFEGGDQRKAEKTAASLGPTENNYDTQSRRRLPKRKKNTTHLRAAPPQQWAARLKWPLSSTALWHI